MSQTENVLYLLKHHEGQWFTHSKIAARMGLSHQAVFKICQKLATEGKIRRQQNGHEWWICYGEPRFPILPPVVLQAITFDWISETRLREVVRADWEEAAKCLKAGAWKATVILCGACLEGILIAALIKREIEVRKRLAPEFKDRPFSALPLRQLSRFGEAFGLMGSGSSDFLIQARNLIHPGVSTREAVPIGKAEAHAAVELLGGCIRRAASFTLNR